MCEFCTKHGEGKKWYEVAGNYAQELAAQEQRQKYMRSFIPNVQLNAKTNMEKLESIKKSFPAVYRFIRTIATYHMKRRHFGQVVPLEDAEKILDMVQSITRVACVCRSVTTGKNNARYCLLLGVNPWDNRIDFADLQDSLETISNEKAKDLLREFDREGLVHSVWTFNTPFIGGMCNCDRDCLAYKMQVGSGLMDLMFKAEYIAVIDITACTGCRNCQKVCQFGAVEYSVASRKCCINPVKCYGCGACRVECKKEAISLIDRI